MSIPMYLRDSFPGEALMMLAVEEAVAQNREACRVEGQRPVCWLYRAEIDRQQQRRYS